MQIEDETSFIIYNSYVSFINKNKKEIHIKNQNQNNK